MTSRAIMCATALSLSACQSVTVQGVELAEHKAFWPTVLLVAGGFAIAAVVSDGDDSETVKKCVDAISVPSDKGVPVVCEGS